MAFPQVQGTPSQGGSDNGTSHVVSMPSGITAGELLLAFIGCDVNPTLTATGWTKLGQQADLDSSSCSAVCYKTADGSDTMTVTTGGANEAITWTVYRISGWSAISGSSTNGDSTNANPPSHTPSGGSGDYLWFAACVADQNVVASAAPANYTDRITAQGLNSSGGLSTARRQLTAASEDPGPFTTSAEAWSAWTVAVAGGAVARELDGHLDAAASASAEATATRLIAGSGPIASSAAGSASADRPVAGSGPSAVSASGSQTVARGLVGVSAAANSATADLLLAGYRGPIAAASSAIASMGTARVFAGNSNSADSGSGSVSIFTNYIVGQINTSNFAVATFTVRHPFLAPADLPRPGMRFMARRILTDEWMDWDLPISDAELIYTLNGFGGITGKVEPEYPDLIDTGLEDDSVWIFGEQDGQIRGHGILRLDAIDGQGLTFDAEGFCSYAHGMYYTGSFAQTNIDPLNIVRHIWTHIQGLSAETNLGIVVDSTTSPVRLGTETREETTVDPNGQTITTTVTIPYQLNWWEKKDLGRELDQLCVEGGFDFTENVSWNSTKTDVNMRLQLGYPRLGRKRNDLRFAQDENLLAAVPLKQDPAQFCTYVFVIGAGEGSNMIVGYAGQRYGNRIGRMKVVEDKSITSKDRATAVARDVLRRSQASVLSISEIVLDARHPNAEYGSFDVGDDITILADVPWLSSVALSHRIVSYSYNPQDEVCTLQLQPSDAFSYEALT